MPIPGRRQPQPAFDPEQARLDPGSVRHDVPLDLGPARAAPGSSQHGEGESPWGPATSVPAGQRGRQPTGRTWAGRPVLDPEHQRDLDAHAAVLEFSGKMDRRQAEQAAYDQYRRQHALQAAGHHLAGFQDARRAGDHEAARQHLAQYQQHAQSLGIDHRGPVHPDVQVAAQQARSQGSGGFRPHPADQLGPVTSAAR